MTWEDLYEQGLSCGLLPEQFWDLTFKEFYYYTGRIRKEEERQWQHTSHLMWLTAQANAGKGQRLSPDDFNPYAANKKRNLGVQSNDDVIALRERVMSRKSRSNKD